MAGRGKEKQTRHGADDQVTGRSQSKEAGKNLPQTMEEAYTASSSASVTGISPNRAADNPLWSYFPQQILL